MALITLTTDFGLGDWFVGTMKGVIASIAPNAKVVDISHGIPGGDVRAGAFALSASYSYFPRHTIHVAVVDPGVGSARAGIAVQTSEYIFVGPDNGLLSLAVAKSKVQRIHRLENRALFRTPVSQTFHGRDIFAPVAAHLSAGVPVRDVGEKAKEIVQHILPKPAVTKREIRGEILYVDRFGNAITNIDGSLLSIVSSREGAVVLHGRRTWPIKAFYQAVKLGQPVGVVGSSGFLEIAVNGGSAAETLGLQTGQAIRLRPA